MTKADLAKDIAALAVVGVTVSLTPGAVATLGAVPPLMGLIGNLRAKWSHDPQHITIRAVDAVLAGMQQSSEIGDTLLADARAVLRAMPDTTQLTQAQLVTATKNGTVLVDDLVALLMAQIPQGANTDAHGLIETALTSGVRACTETEEFRTALSFGLLQALSRDMTQVKDNTTVTRDMTAQLLVGLEGILRPDMNTLAHRFGHSNPEGAGLTDLKGFLMQKAEDFRLYQAQIDAIDDRVTGMGNLKAAAKDAAERLDFAEVEMLLARVDKVETEIAAQTKELRAENALLQGKVDAAYAHLNASADSFQGLDPLEPARRKVGYEDRLYSHGQRYGGAGLMLAAQMLQGALADLSQADQPRLWARAQNGLGIALQAQGIRTEGPEGTRLLADAVTAYNAALRVRTEDARPLDWAALHNNLGVALMAQGNRTSGSEGTKLLAKAFTAFSSALRVTTEGTHPLDWAMTQDNLGNALRLLGSRTVGPERTRLLAEAVTAYKATLRVRTENTHRLDWAATQNNLGGALDALGSLIAGPNGAGLLAKAVSAYNATLNVYTEDAYPLHWAATQNNLGVALKNQGSRTAGPVGAGLLANAVSAYKAALRVRTEDAHPLDWAITQENIAIAEVAQAQHDSCTAPLPHLRSALLAVNNALRVFDPENLSYDYVTATELCENIRARLRALGDDV